MAIFQFFSDMAAFHHLGFIAHLLRPPTEGTQLVIIIVAQNLVRIDLVYSFNNMKSFNIMRVWLENAHAPKLV